MEHPCPRCGTETKEVFYCRSCMEFLRQPPKVKPETKYQYWNEDKSPAT